MLYERLIVIRHRAFDRLGKGDSLASAYNFRLDRYVPVNQTSLFDAIHEIEVEKSKGEQSTLFTFEDDIQDLTETATESTAQEESPAPDISALVQDSAPEVKIEEVAEEVAEELVEEKEGEEEVALEEKEQPTNKKEEIEGDEAFAEQLSKLGSVYVNDAFGTAHRAHASTTIMAKYFSENKCFGALLAKEVKAIDKVLKNGESPIVAILGGAKVSSKITIIESLLDKVDHLIIGGGMVYTSNN